MVARIAVLVASLVLFATAVVPADESPVEINVILPLTGLGSFAGRAKAQSLRVFESLTNSNGGIDGRPIRFVIADDQYNPQVSVQLFNQIAAKHVSIVMGPDFTAACNAVLPLIADGPVTYCLSPGVHPPPGSYMFAANVSTEDLVRARLRYMHQRGWTRLATILTNDASGQDIARQLDGELALPQNSSLRIVSRQTFNPTDLSVTAQMANIKAAGAQVLLTGATGAPFGTLLRDARAVDLDIPVFASSTNMTPQQMSQYDAFLPSDLMFANPLGIVVDPQVSPSIQRAERTFFAAFQPSGIVPGQGETIPWDPAAIVVDALRHAGPNATPAALRSYIAGLDHWVGASGDYDFRKIPQRGIGIDSVVIYRWDALRHDYTIVSKPGGDLWR